VTSANATPASVHVLGAVYGVTPGLPKGQRVQQQRTSVRGLSDLGLWDSKEQSDAFMQNTLVPALPVDGGFVGPPEERAAQVAHHDTV
jgi:hypothetical protein